MFIKVIAAHTYNPSGILVVDALLERLKDTFLFSLGYRRSFLFQRGGWILSLDECGGNHAIQIHTFIERLEQTFAFYPLPHPQGGPASLFQPLHEGVGSAAFGKNIKTLHLLREIIQRPSLSAKIPRP